LLKGREEVQMLMTATTGTGKAAKDRARIAGRERRRNTSPGQEQAGD
jgi:hypothetical protein